jgi:hypothetical protein
VTEHERRDSSHDENREVSRKQPEWEPVCGEDEKLVFGHVGIVWMPKGGEKGVKLKMQTK